MVWKSAESTSKLYERNTWSVGALGGQTPHQNRSSCKNAIAAIKETKKKI